MTLAVEGLIMMMKMTSFYLVLKGSDPLSDTVAQQTDSDVTIRQCTVSNGNISAPSNFFGLFFL